MAEAAAGEETIVYGDLDLGMIAEEQQALDVVGHYNRPDIFQLSVDESARQAVVWTHPASHGHVAAPPPAELETLARAD